MDFRKRNYFEEFIKEEVDYYLKEANFDSRERLLFLLRNDKVSIEEVAEKMNCSVSTVNRINRTMKKKIIKSADGYYRGISKTWK